MGIFIQFAVIENSEQRLSGAANLFHIIEKSTKEQMHNFRRFVITPN